MKVTRWNKTQSFLSFTISTNHIHYPTCLLNGKLPESRIFQYNGEYSYNIQTAKYYSLVCRIQYDTKEYILEDSFYNSKDSKSVIYESMTVNHNIVNYLWLILLGFVASIIVWLICYAINNINRLKGYSLIEGSNRDVKENEILEKNSLIRSNDLRIETQSLYDMPMTTNEWRCQSCMYLNKIKTKKCEMCHSLNPDYQENQK